MRDILAGDQDGKKGVRLRKVKGKRAKEKE